MKKLLRKTLFLALGLLRVLRLAAAEPVETGGLVFTEEERAWIAAHPVVRVGQDATYPPYAFLDAKGNLVGIDLDYLAHIAHRTGLRFQNEVREDWPHVLTAFKAGEVDVLMSLGYLPERENFLIYSRPYSYAPDVVVMRDDTAHLLDLSDLNGRRVGIVRGYDTLRAELADAAPSAIPVEYPTTEAALVGLARGEVYGTLADVVNAAYLVKTRRLTNLRLGSVIGMSGSSEIRLGVRKDLPVLAGIIDKALADISAAERHEISNRWVAVDVQDDRWSSRAVKIASAVAAGVLFVLLLLFLHNRRLARELAERRRIQAELEQAYDRLAEISEQKSELLRTVTHDLRNPLTGLTLGIDLLRLGRGADDTRRNLDQMRATAQQMMRLINDLVDANVLETGRRNFSWARVDAAAVFREAVESLTAPATRKAIRLTFTAQEPAMSIQSDLTALRQVADNLVSNAVKFSPRDSAVEVEVRWTGTGLRVQVRDHGPGISPEARAKVFTQYGLGDAKPTGGEKSTGLGLWIAQRVVAALHGRVWSEDAAGGGALFVVELPRHPPVTPG
ncbi:transporter substrate-binding domain-containing protein [Opitutus sp. GAS368]|uniref:transporter substrate-binding domain-containing protein n=1 Tax=Opitutus sp. GAS368 TaxID=1882749 RepID=UPI0015612E95|nr:transporter substrate-binding domain-containing protein [Opitutus sp. GAS368]